MMKTKYFAENALKTSPYQMEYVLFQTARKLDLEVVSNVLKDGDKINGEVVSYMIVWSFRMLKNANRVPLE